MEPTENPVLLDIMSKLTEREWDEVQFATIYAASFNHGTDGHHRLKLIAKLYDLLIDSMTQKELPNG